MNCLKYLLETIFVKNLLKSERYTVIKILESDKFWYYILYNNDNILDS